jgi:hypothetical protein
MEVDEIRQRLLNNVAGINAGKMELLLLLCMGVKLGLAQ